MVPASFRPIVALPRSANGKVDRRALAALGGPSRAEAAAPLVERRELTPTQARVAEIWGELLGVEPSDLDEDFFDAGGHSILAVRLVGRLREAFGRELSLRAVFERATVAGIAAALEARASS